MTCSVYRTLGFNDKCHLKLSGSPDSKVVFTIITFWLRTVAKVAELTLHDTTVKTCNYSKWIPQLLLGLDLVPSVAEKYLFLRPEV